ncbi:hypothetical protein JG688_00002676, partial [Phytophthora aleatoria]
PRPRDQTLRVTPSTVNQVQTTLRIRLHKAELARRASLTASFRHAGIRTPNTIASISTLASETSTIDHDLCNAFSKLVSQSSLSLSATIALWRDEYARDPRPNKALDPEWLDILLHGYRHHRAAVNAATHGVSHTFNSPRGPDIKPGRNHKSARQFGSALERSIASGQATGTYLVVKLSRALQWHELQFSPFDCVEKKGADPAFEARLIHDLSYPDDSSINARSTIDDLPDLDYESVRRLAKRMLKVRIDWSRCHQASRLTLLDHIVVNWPSSTCRYHSAGLDLPLTMVPLEEQSHSWCQERAHAH